MPYPIEPIEAARAVLDAHADYEAARDVEPAVDAEGQPFEPELWRVWCDETGQPAQDALSAALEALEAQLGPEDFPGRHPAHYLPVCRTLSDMTAQRQEAHVLSAWNCRVAYDGPTYREQTCDHPDCKR